jgi:hypothetical protein
MFLLLLPQAYSDWLGAQEKNIANMRRLDAEASRLKSEVNHPDAKVGTRQGAPKTSRPRPRRVLPQRKDLYASESGEKTT